MPSKAKVTFSLDIKMVEKIAEISTRRGIPKSRLVEEALRSWQRSQMERELEEGYRAMAEEDRAFAEEHLPAVREDWK